MMNESQRELPRYQSHKIVHAIKIKEILHGECQFMPDDPEYGPIEHPPDYLSKHSPQPGGYYVAYEDGYVSYSPAQAFEDGYTKIK